MTVAVEQNYIIYTADGTLNTFTFNFTPIKPESVLVYLYDLNNVKTQLTYQTDYSVTINSDGVGGSVTLVNTPTSGYKILIQRYVDYDQETVYPENSPFPSKSHEKALDKLTILTQQLKDKVDRSIYRDEIVDITDFKGARIINIANAVDNNDALNKGQLLSEIQAVDGSGSGIDADMLDGKQATDFVANDDNVVLNMVKNVDGLYSGLDADLVRGKAIPSPIPANKWLGSDANGNYNWKDIVTKDNKVVSQATNPDTTFDIDAGYNVGDVVINTTTDKIYVCVDNTASAAEWVQTAELSASEILDKIKTVDGAGSGLDADTVDSHNPSDIPQAGDIPVIDSDNKLALPFTANVPIPITVGSQPVMYRTYYVDAVNGDDSNDGSETNPFKTVKTAINSIPNGGVGFINLANDYSLNSDVELWSMYKKKIYINNSGYTLNINQNNATRFIISDDILLFYGSGTVNVNFNADTSDSIFWSTYTYVGESLSMPNNVQFINENINFNDNSGTTTIKYFISAFTNVRFKGCSITLNSSTIKLLLLYGNQPTLFLADGSSIVDSAGNSVSFSDVVTGIVKDSNGVPRNILSDIIF